MPRTVDALRVARRPVESPGSGRSTGQHQRCADLAPPRVEAGGGAEGRARRARAGSAARVPRRRHDRFRIESSPLTACWRGGCRRRACRGIVRGSCAVSDQGDSGALGRKFRAEVVGGGAWLEFPVMYASIMDAVPEGRRRLDQGSVGRDSPFDSYEWVDLSHTLEEDIPPTPLTPGSANPSTSHTNMVKLLATTASR